MSITHTSDGPGPYYYLEETPGALDIDYSLDLGTSPKNINFFFTNISKITGSSLPAVTQIDENSYEIHSSSVMNTVTRTTDASDIVAERGTPDIPMFHFLIYRVVLPTITGPAAD